ncbi:protein draper-like [Lontra canadensis]|uniref:protein draper-like n=1 Tax=Lontra canadensis TaxID=76717 RepID=UPI0013F37D74|nr:protein draper-like [Lontra canadensis]
MPLAWKMEETAKAREFCPPGTYGKDCKQVCQCSAENEECHLVTGRCTCLPGYHGNRCHLQLRKSVQENIHKRCGWLKNKSFSSQKQLGFHVLEFGVEIQIFLSAEGLNCQRICKCLNGSNCDTVIGTCYCPPGFIGADCSQICPVDHYGQDCVQQCSCGSGQCDPVTGGCQCPPGQMGARYQQDFSTKSSRSHLQFPKYTKHIVIRTIKGVPKQCLAQTVS